MISQRNAKPPTPEAQKAFDRLAKEVESSLEKDNRSAMTRMMSAVMIHAAGVSAAKRAMTAIRENFVDWNEVRISDNRELVTVLSRAEVEKPEALGSQLRQILMDIYEQYNVTNLEYETLDEAIFCRAPVPEGEENPDSTTIRDEGLPKHPVHTGFLDGPRLLSETTILEAKIVREKNSDIVFSAVYDNPGHISAAIVWAVALSHGMLEENLNPLEALPKLREILQREAITFARNATLSYEKNSRSMDKFFKQQAPMPVEDDGSTPFSVQIGFMSMDEVRRNEPLMPRSDGIGRESKRARPKLHGKKAAAAEATAGRSSRMKAVAAEEAAKPVRLQKVKK
jgi:hypothetical protein